MISFISVVDHRQTNKQKILFDIGFRFSTIVQVNMSIHNNNKQMNVLNKIKSILVLVSLIMSKWMMYIY